MRLQPMLTLTNNHLCAYTDGEKSTYVFHTNPVIAVSNTVDLKPDTEVLERGADAVDLDR